MAVPVFSGLAYAFLYSIGIFGILNSEINFDAWKSVLTDFHFWKSILFSLYVGILSVSISSVLSFLIAISWRSNFKSGLLSYVIYLPLCFPATVVAFFIFQMFSQSGFVSRITNYLQITDGISNFPVLINDTLGIGIIFTMILLISPFFIILFSAVYESERIDELSDLGSTLGASKSQIMKKIVIPIVFKKTAVSLILFILFVMGNYEVPLLLGGQNPQLISVAIVQKITRFNLYDIPNGFAMSIIYVTFLIVLLGFLAIKNPNFFATKEHND